MEQSVIAYPKIIACDHDKPGVNAQFLTDKEQLAFQIRSEKGEEDNVDARALIVEGEI